MGPERITTASLPDNPDNPGRQNSPENSQESPIARLIHGEPIPLDIVLESPNAREYIWDWVDQQYAAVRTVYDPETDMEYQEVWIPSAVREARKHGD